MSALAIRALLLSAMSAAGVSALWGCDVLAEDFTVTCPDQKQWLTRFAGTRLRRGVRRRATLAHIFRCLGYSSRPEYFTMYACLYNMVRRSVRWLQSHAEQLREAQEAFEETHGFECPPAAAIARVLRKKKELLEASRGCE